MQTDQIVAPSIRYVVLIIDELRLIIEYTGGSRAQVLGEEAIVCWQQFRRGNGRDDEQQDLHAAQGAGIQRCSEKES